MYGKQSRVDVQFVINENSEDFLTTLKRVCKIALAIWDISLKVLFKELKQNKLSYFML